MNFAQLLITSVLFNVTANILLKKGVNTIGGISPDKSKVIGDIIKAFSNPLIFIGVFLYGLSFLIWLRVLSFNDLSRAYPIFVSFVFLLTTLGSFFFLKESIPLMRVVGILIILVGIYFVAKT